jgi:hypothetical protein
MTNRAKESKEKCVNMFTFQLPLILSTYQLHANMKNTQEGLAEIPEIKLDENMAKSLILSNSIILEKDNGEKTIYDLSYDESIDCIEEYDHESDDIRRYCASVDRDIDYSKRITNATSSLLNLIMDKKLYVISIINGGVCLKESEGEHVYRLYSKD